jgi:hypothetical protein
MSMEPESSGDTKQTIIWTAGALALVAAIAVFASM